MRHVYGVPNVRIVVLCWVALLLTPLAIVAETRGASPRRSALIPPRAGEAAPDLFTLVKRVNVTPDGNWTGGGCVRIYDLQEEDRLVVTFNAAFGHLEEGCGDSAHVYKEYTTDMQPTGDQGILACIGADIGSLLVGDSYYLVNLHREGETDGWEISRFDSETWALELETFCALDDATELPGDEMVSFVDGMLDVSSQYNPTGTMPDLMTGAASHHRFFTPDLGFVERKVLDDTPHICGSSLIEVDGMHYLVSANAFLGDVVVMAYDSEWTFLGVKLLLRLAHWSTGLAWDGQRFYLAYLDTSLRTYPNSLPVSLNVRLAAFDRNWNLVEDIPVTEFTWEDLKQPGRPSLLLRGNRLYVTWDCDSIDPETHEEEREWQANVAVYDIADVPRLSRGRPIARPDADCPGGRSPLGVLRSTDDGATWTSLGNACMQGSNVFAVDPTPLVLDGKIALYAVDLDSLGRPVAQSIYLVTSDDGVNFDAPFPVYTQSGMMVDPFVVEMPDGRFRLYVPSESEGIISAVSDDGMTFVREAGVRTEAGGMPGAIVLPDGRVRLFLCGGGIFSMISDDGLDFTLEDGLRIPPPFPTALVDNPEPIRLDGGGYLMLYSVHDTRNDGLLPWEYTEIHLATSQDGLTWTTSATVIGYGGTSCVVETPDGTLYIYYVNR